MAGIIFTSFAFSLKAQDSAIVKLPDTLRAVKYKKPVLTILLPLYLDSAFDASGQYRYGKQFPRFMLPGLEFYEGVQLAIDSLKKEGVVLDVNIVDTRSSQSLGNILAQSVVKNADLLLAHISFNELKPLAEFANDEKLPFINVNLPNDGGVTNNPYMVILNSTLQSHCEGIYNFLQRNYGKGPIVVFRKAGAQEDRLKAYFSDVEKATMGTALKLKYVTLPDGFTEAQLKIHLDSNRITMAVAGSLDEGFARHLAIHLATLNKTYPVQVMGMPTWDGIRDLDKKEYKDLEIFYSIPFNPVRTDALSEAIGRHFKDNLFSRPSDMVFRGYETMYRFGKLLQEQGPNISSSIGEKKHKVFTDFDIQPVLLDNQKQQLDYFENKKLYIIKKLNGAVQTVF
ncbi:hypothetical protein HY58_10585 [Flavihumibacter sp. ZG627]|nr:hypothetical protein HY58_10585 [Flavihumibacter sp. ZG627]